MKERLMYFAVALFGLGLWLVFLWGIGEVFI
jgi:hypothetical protein